MPHSEEAEREIRALSNVLDRLDQHVENLEAENEVLREALVQMLESQIGLLGQIAGLLCGNISERGGVREPGSERQETADLDPEAEGLCSRRA